MNLPHVLRRNWPLLLVTALVWSLAGAGVFTSDPFDPIRDQVAADAARWERATLVTQIERDREAERQRLATELEAQKKASYDAGFAQGYAARLAQRGGSSRPCVKPTPEYGGADVLPVEIILGESGGNYRALNCGSGAGGKYQFIQSTWDANAGRLGLWQFVGTPPHLVPAWAQDAVARYVWNGGAGCSHWSQTSSQC